MRTTQQEQPIRKQEKSEVRVVTRTNLRRAGGAIRVSGRAIKTIAGMPVDLTRKFVNSRYTFTGGFTPEQKKQWRSYSIGKQRTLIHEAEDIVTNAPATAPTASLRNHVKSVNKTTGRASWVSHTNTRARVNANVKARVNAHTNTKAHPNAKARNRKSPEFQKAISQTLNKHAPSDRFEVSIPKGKTARQMKKSIKKGDLKKVTFYADNTKKGTRKVKKLKKTYRNQVRKERRPYHKKRDRLIDRDAQKRRQIKQRIQRGDIQLDTAGKQVGGQALKEVLLPVRYLTAKMGVRVRNAVASFALTLAKKALKTLLMICAPLLLPLLILCPLLFLLAGAGGSAESGSGAVSAYGLYSSATGEQIVAYAKQFVGNPYKWGGNSYTEGIDCSHFVTRVLTDCGVYSGGYLTSYGWQNAGEEVASLSDAVAGDIICYMGHVAIYDGNSRIVEAQGDLAGITDNRYADRAGSILTIRRFVTDVQVNQGEGGYRTDTSNYSTEDIELIWAIVAQEDSGSYEGALAVITTAMNRADNNYGGYGTSALQQLTAPSQFCYSLGTNYQKRLNGNVNDFVKQAVTDCLVNGIRNHTFLSFRSNQSSSGDRVQIGLNGNWYFNSY